MGTKLDVPISIDNRTAWRSRNVFAAKTHILLVKISPDGKATFLNQVWQTMLGFTPVEMRSRPFREILPYGAEAADVLMGLLLDRTCHAPVETSVRSRSGLTKRILWHRRFETSDAAMYLAGEEIEHRAENGAGRSEGDAAA